MKKILFVMIAVIAMSFAACGNKTISTSAKSDSDTVLVDSTDTTVADTLTADSVNK